MDVRTVLAVAAGAAIGGVLRFVITTLVVGRFGPGLGFYATFGINVVGSYLIGLVLGLAQERVDFDPLLQAFLAVGVLGGFYDVLDLRIRGVTHGDSGARLTAALYVSGSVALGFGGAYLGVATARALGR